MLCKTVCSPKYLIGILLTAMALVAFNLGQPGIERDTASTFNAWYEQAATKLGPSAEPQQADLALRVTVSVKDALHGDAPTVWNVPSSSLLDRGERENTSRVLQLIRESGVFGFTPLRNPASASSLLALSIKDGEQQFDITVPYSAIEQSIQLQNLLKLLDVYSNQPDTSHVEPARL